MARPEDMLARGNARSGAGYDQGFDDPQAAPRRDPRRPFDQQQRGREEAPLRAGPPPQPVPPRGAGPGVTPQFDPYVPQQPAPRQAAPQQSRPPMAAPPQQAAQQQAYGSDPYAQPRQARPNGAALPSNQAPPTSGRPGQTQRPPAQTYAQQPGYAPLQGQPARGQPAYDAVPPTGRVREPFFEAPPSARQPLPGRQPAGIAQDGYGDDPFSSRAQDDAGYDDDDAESEVDEIAHEAAPRRYTGMFIALALLAVAVAVGGGGGYIYTKGFGHRVNGATPPVVQADAAPVKVMADDAAAGAADPNKKTILERADGSADAQPPATVPSQEKVAMAAGGNAPADPLASPRKVATVVVRPGEKIALGSASAANTQPVDAVPGLSVGDDTAAIETVKPKVKAVIKPAQAAVDTAVDAGTGTAAAMADPAAQPVKLGKAVKKAVVAAVTPPPEPDAAAAADPAPAQPATAPAKIKTANAAPKAGGSGYLIQVRSTKTQQEALAFFADLQQRYGDLLGASQPDIQEADLGTKGLWYRLRIGPPGSSAAAHDLCVKLKTAGLKDCITAAY